MIVKNESSIIVRCLDAVKKYIDYIVITDTGSTDNTPSIIRNYLNENQIQGKVYNDEWQNFGYNRTKSLLNAREWLISESIPLEKNYFLTIDADMILCENKDELYDKNNLSLSESWIVLQKTPSIKYYNMRVFRSDLPFSCKGVTHEYWSCDKSVSQNRLKSLYIDDRGDGGCKSDKFTRDISLLKKGIMDEPDNKRYYFYLAQSYADNGDDDDALTWYQKRIEASGWKEEIFMSHYRKGNLYAKKGNFDNAIIEWMYAYEKLPIRSETLHRIIQHFRIVAKHQLAMIFLKQALSLSYPHECILFIEFPVYQYKIIEEFSIISYYISHIPKNIGGSACQYLLFNKTIPNDVKQKALSNSYFYIQPIQKILSMTFKFKCPFPYITSSSALYLDTDQSMKGVVRCVNYSMTDTFQYMIRDKNNIVRTENFWIEITSDCEIKSFSPIKINSTCSKKRNSHIAGLEDMRICKIGDDIYGIAVSWEYGENNHPSIVYFRMDKNEEGYIIENIKHVRYHNKICQKNWTLFTQNNNLYAIYSHSPLIILELDKNFQNEEMIFIEKESLYDLSNCRGSSSPIWIEDKKQWLICVHEVVCKDTRKYYHRFLSYDKEWNLTGISQPFYFNHLYVEFTLSIIYNSFNDCVSIPFSSKDNTTEMAKIKYSSIEWLPLTHIKNETMGIWLYDKLKEF